MGKIFGILGIILGTFAMIFGVIVLIIAIEAESSLSSPLIEFISNVNYYLSWIGNTGNTTLHMAQLISSYSYMIGGAGSVFSIVGTVKDNTKILGIAGLVISILSTISGIIASILFFQTYSAYSRIWLRFFGI